MKTRSIHYISGLILAAFTGLHLVNHLCALAGAGRHIAVMHALRPIYRNPVVEVVLLVAVLVQIISGIRLFRKGRGAALSGFDRLHVWTGLYLAVFFVIHVSAVFAGRYLLQLDTNFYFGAAGLNVFPFSLFFVPYYTLGILSFFGHVAAIHRKRQQHNLLGLSPQRQATAMLVLGLGMTVAILYGLTNRFRGESIPAEYNLLNSLDRIEDR